ncbi:MAG: response regulator [Actinomycetota bacterium]|nr:response regulator [Actinomycetota bacterium]
MAKIVLVSDARTVLEELRAVVDDGVNELVELNDGAQARAAATAEEPDLVIADSQVQSMGGFAVCLDLKLEASGGRLPAIPTLVLLDRRADVFLARRAGAEGFLVKPLDPLRLRRAVTALLAGGTYEDESFKPVTIPAS